MAVASVSNRHGLGLAYTLAHCASGFGRSDVHDALFRGHPAEWDGRRGTSGTVCRKPPAVGELDSVDIGTPADSLLLVFNLSAFMALLASFPLTYWMNPNLCFAAQWGLIAVGPWFLVGRYFDIRRGLVAVGKPKLPTWLRKVLFSTTMVGEALARHGSVFAASVTAPHRELEWRPVSSSADSYF